MDPRDNRLRPSVLVQYGGHNVVIDTTPDFRTQVLRAKLDRLDAVLFTHSHADHIMGLDDVRPFNFRQRTSIPIFASAEAMSTIQRCFEYIFIGDETESSVPHLETHTLNGKSFQLFGQEFVPVRLLHGRKSIYGFRFGQAAYLTDHSDIPAESMEQLADLDVLFLDALRHKPHPTHSTVEKSMQTVERLAPRRAFFTHICHDLSHEETESALPPHIRLAYDGLEITVGGTH
jgi:phosphoribosyl 1,2-cyclic phosphate phosphodiesterase